jgi:hypothetical protein
VFQMKFCIGSKTKDGGNQLRELSDGRTKKIVRICGWRRSLDLSKEHK